MTKPKEKPAAEQLEQLRAELRAERLAAAAAAALHRAGCVSPALFEPHAVARLGFDADDEIRARDEDDALMHGSTADDAVRELVKAYPRFFTRR